MAVRQKYVSSSFIFTMCLNSYYILEEVFLNITDEIFSNFLFILSVRSRSEYEGAADGSRADRSETDREIERVANLIFLIDKLSAGCWPEVACVVEPLC